MKKILIAIISLFIATVTFSVEIDIAGAVNMAYENNYEVKNAKKDLENYGLQVKEAYKAGLPKLSYSGLFTKLEEYKGSEGNMIDGNYSNIITIKQPIFMGGKVITGINASKKAKDLSDYNFIQKKNDIKFAVEKAYIGILKLQKQKEIIETSLKKLKEDYIKVGALYDLNMVSKSSVLELDYSISQVESSLIEVENGIEISKLQLKNSIGIPDSEVLNLKDIVTGSDYSDKASIENDVKYALENNLNVKRIRISSSLQKDSEVISRAALLPTVGFQFDYGASNQTKMGDAFKSDKMGWKATVAINYDIWSWGENVNKLQRVKNETSKVNETEKNSITNIEIAIRNCYLSLIRYDKIIDSKNKSYISAKENYEIYKEKLTVGIISTTDFLASESNLRKAEIEYRNMELEYYMAYIEYNYLVNREE